jgi:hypothetical protein
LHHLTGLPSSTKRAKQDNNFFAIVKADLSGRVFKEINIVKTSFNTKTKEKAKRSPLKEFLKKNESPQ